MDGDLLHLRERARDRVVLLAALWVLDHRRGPQVVDAAVAALLAGWDGDGVAALAALTRSEAGTRLRRRLPAALAELGAELPAGAEEAQQRATWLLAREVVPDAALDPVPEVRWRVVDAALAGLVPPADLLDVELEPGGERGPGLGPYEEPRLRVHLRTRSGTFSAPLLRGDPGDAAVALAGDLRGWLRAGRDDPSGPA